MFESLTNTRNRGSGRFAAQMDTAGQTAMTTSASTSAKPYMAVKRFFDVLTSFVLLIPAALIVSLCYILIKLETCGPAFFVQERPGYKGRIFKIYKLRTMIVDTEKDGRKLTDMERLTKTGKIIRACSFDELPQLLNVLKGEMSFIGPRPLLVEYLPLYSPEQMRRHDILPGISGWAQVNGRNELTWEQKFERDVWYVDNVSLLLDLKIICMTIVNVFNHQGINAGVSDTMAVFNGNAGQGREDTEAGDTMAAFDENAHVERKCG